MSKNLIRGRAPARRDVLALGLAAVLPATAAAQPAYVPLLPRPGEPLNAGVADGGDVDETDT